MTAPQPKAVEVAHADLDAGDYALVMTSDGRQFTGLVNGMESDDTHLAITVYLRREQITECWTTR